MSSRHFFASVFPVLASFSARASAFSTVARSAMKSSVSIILLSRSGLIEDSTWIIFSFSKARTTSQLHPLRGYVREIGFPNPRQRRRLLQAQQYLRILWRLVSALRFLKSRQARP